MPIVGANGIELCYEVRGDADGVPLLLVNGLGSQMSSWEEGFLDALVDRGFTVITFDNRDVGLSTWIDTPDLDLGAAIAAGMSGEKVDAPYRLTDMAADAVALLDALEIEAAHIVGMSMGGMIVQTIAIEHPHRVLSLTSVMSTTGERDVGHPTPEAAAVLVRPVAKSRDEVIANSVETQKIIGSPDAYDDAKLEERAAIAYDRAFNPIGVGRQLLGITASGSRAKQLAELRVPTLVIHGSVDPLVGISGGRRTAELVPGATFVEIEGMAHDLPPFAWASIVDEITRLAASAAAGTEVPAGTTPASTPGNEE